MPVNQEQILADRIWALLDRDADFSGSEGVAPKNRIKWHETATLNDPEPADTTDDEYPQAILRTANRNTSLFEGPPEDSDVTFATHSDSYDPNVYHWTETADFIFELTLTSKFLSQKESSSLATFAINAIRKGGPKLGNPSLVEAIDPPLPALPPLDGVHGVKIESSTEVFDGDDQGYTRREVTTMRIFVRRTVDGQTLL